MPHLDKIPAPRNDNKDWGIIMKPDELKIRYLAVTSSVPGIQTERSRENNLDTGKGRYEREHKEDCGKQK